VSVIIQILKAILEVFSPRIMAVFAQPKTKTLEMADAHLERFNPIDNASLVARFDNVLRE